VKKSCVAACQKSVRMTVESVSGCSWNECPDQRGMGVRVSVESALYQQARTRHPGRWSGETRNWEPIGAVMLNPEREQPALEEAA